MPSLLWFALSMVALVAWGICLFRFRVVLRRAGAPLMSDWQRMETSDDWVGRFRDDAALFDQLMQRQPIPTAERWRRATLLMAAIFLLNLAAPVLLLRPSG